MNDINYQSPQKQRQMRANCPGKEKYLSGNKVIKWNMFSSLPMCYLSELVWILCFPLSDHNQRCACRIVMEVTEEVTE